MIDANLYEYIYLFVVAILTIHQYLNYNRYSWSRLSAPPAQNNVLALMLTLGLIAFIGLRPVSNVFVDMVGYSHTFDFYKGDPFTFDWSVDNKLFDNLFMWLSSLRVDHSLFFVIIAAIYFGGIFIACRKMFPRDVLFAMLVYLAAFSTFPAGVNGIKAGAAASLFFVALAYRDKKIISYIFVALAYGFHHSMQIVVVAYILASLLKTPKYYIWGWIVSLVIAVLHITFFQQLFAGFTDEHGAKYLLVEGDESAYLTGFRLDFIIYSAIPIIIGYYLIFKRKLQSERFNFIYNIYVIANSVWLLCMYASYTNRIAYLSWQLLPIVLIYPFFNEKISPSQYKIAAIVAFAHLGFTLFMEFIY